MSDELPESKPQDGTSTSTRASQTPSIMKLDKDFGQDCLKNETESQNKPAMEITLQNYQNTPIPFIAKKTEMSQPTVCQVCSGLIHPGLYR